MQKTSHAANHPARRFSGCLAGGARPLRDSRVRLWRGLCACRHALTGNPSRYAESDAEGAADALRFHFDLMVTAPIPLRL
jgi:hypothetical protein